MGTLVAVVALIVMAVVVDDRDVGPHFAINDGLHAATGAAFLGKFFQHGTVQIQGMSTSLLGSPLGFELR